MNKYLSSSWNSVVSRDLDNSWASRSLQDALRNSKYDARFQQRQMAEKEEKLLKLYENQQQRAFDKVNHGSAGSNGSLSNITTGNGKVRQMFDERRQKAGIDRSYPLEPLSKTMPVPSKTNTTRGNSLDRRPLNQTIKTTSRTTTRTTTKLNSTMRKPLANTGLYNNNNNSRGMDEAEKYLQEHEDLVKIMNKNNINDDLEDEVMPRIGFDDLGYDEDIFTGKLANVGGKLPSQIVVQKSEVKSTTKPGTNKNGVGKPPAKRLVQQQRPAQIKQQAPPSPATSLTSSRNNNTRSESSSSGNSSKESTPTASPAKTMSRPLRPPQSGDAMRAPSSATARPSARTSVLPQSVQRDDLTACRFCQRRFQTDRIQKHEDICGRTAKKKRKVFDSTKHRVSGTDVEPYAKRISKTVNKSKATTSNTGWRQKHEEFIAAIRAAKQAQAHIAKGGDIRDLPPPPPSSNPDYVQCPHCGRRFNESAAARHIPKCANYQFNKPKPGRK
ncbi:zinc finger C2HC domain-containing protein 1C isoform X2 [Atheta coriaria]|uniref:zinc finger C2HC domain-containing protein 1C isoform X2 n=1 Tax=Dalotia coriaria TaxID=877792 RepID=UPI0031F4582A